MYSIRETKVCIVSRCHLVIAAQHGVDCLQGYGVNSIESTFMLPRVEILTMAPRPH